MTILITPISPTYPQDPEDPPHETSRSVVVQVTTPGPEKVLEETLAVAVAGQPVLTGYGFGADGFVAAGTNVFTSIGAKSFGPQDVGRSLFVPSLGKFWVSSVESPQSVTVVRPDVSGTVTVAAGQVVVTGTDTYFQSELSVGQWIVIGGEYGDPVQISGIVSNTELVLTYGPQSDHTDAALELEPTWHQSLVSLDWVLHGFAPGWGGTVKPITDGFEIQCWATRQLSGVLSIPQPDIEVPTGTLVSGSSTRFRSELDAGALVFLQGRRTHEDPFEVPTVAADDTLVISPYPKQNTPVVGYRDADLPGTYDAAQQTTVTVEARNTAGEAFALEYTFSVSTRPRVIGASPQAANPFGLGLRVNFSQHMMGWASGTNEPIGNPDSYQVIPINPGLPTPTITAVTFPSGNPTYVDLTFSAALANQQQYRVVVSNMGIRGTPSDLAGPYRGSLLDDAPNNSVIFTGYGPAEEVELWKDTMVSTPTITGPQLIDYPSAFSPPSLQYNLVNLDPDVIGIQLGESADGVELVGGSFVNNGDGTGSFDVAFSSLKTSYILSVELVDDVANVSDESNELSITARPDTIPGTSLEIRPLYPAHSETCDRLLGDIPAGSFYLRAGFVIPYHYEPMPFTLKVVERGRPVTIAVTRENKSGRFDEAIYKTIIPGSLTETVMLVMGRGRNLIYVTDGERNDFITCSATTYATVLCSIASEIFGHTHVPLQEVRDAVYSPLSSRLAEPFLPAPDLLPSPPLRSNQQMALKLAIRGHVVDPGTERAVRDMTTAITLQTPVQREMRNPRQRFKPFVESIYNPQESFGGVELHSWFHNDCINRWDAFTRYLANSPELFRPMRVSEDEIVYEDQTGTVRRHVFDFSDPDCSSINNRINCFDNIGIKVLFFGDMNIPICAAQYPFDSCFTPEHHLGSRSAFGDGSLWDTTTLDYDMLDPGEDGWVGFCWAERWDSGVVISSHIKGAYTAGQAIFRLDEVSPNTFPYTFTSADAGRWVRVTSGTRQQTHRIINVLGENRVLIDWTSDVTETNLTWELVRDVRVLDSMGPALGMPITTSEEDGSTTEGSDVFTTGGQYAFSDADVGRNIVIIDHDNEVVSVLIAEVLAPSYVRVGRPIGGTTEPYLFKSSKTKLTWEIWGNTTPECGWDGYANSVVGLHSSDLGIRVNIAPKVLLDAPPEFFAAGEPNLNGVAGLYGTSIAGFQAAMEGNFTPANTTAVLMTASASLSAAGRRDPGSFVNLRASASLFMTSEGGTSNITGEASLQGYSWAVGEGIMSIVGGVQNSPTRLSGKATVTGSELTYIRNGEATFSAACSLVATGSVA